MESSRDAQQPSLCKRGCGFFGHSEFEHLCSQCYQQLLKERGQDPAARAKSAALAVKADSGTPAAEAPSTPPKASAPIAIPGAATPRHDGDDSCSSVDPESPCASSVLSEEGESATKKKNRCGVCRKRVGLTGFECRCGGLFCGLHRYSDKHDCTFDWKAHGKGILEKANPVVVADKVQKI